MRRLTAGGKGAIDYCRDDVNGMPAVRRATRQQRRRIVRAREKSSARVGLLHTGGPALGPGTIVLRLRLSVPGSASLTGWGLTGLGLARGLASAVGWARRGPVTPALAGGHGKSIPPCGAIRSIRASSGHSASACGGSSGAPPRGEPEERFSPRCVTTFRRPETN